MSPSLSSRLHAAHASKDRDTRPLGIERETRAGSRKEGAKPAEKKKRERRKERVEKKEGRTHRTTLTTTTLCSQPRPLGHNRFIARCAAAGFLTHLNPLSSRSHYPRLSVLPACPPYQLTSPVSRLTTVSIGALLRPPSKLPYLSIPAARIPSSHSTTYIVPRAYLHNLNSSIPLSFFSLETLSTPPSPSPPPPPFPRFLSRRTASLSASNSKSPFCITLLY